MQLHRVSSDSSTLGRQHQNFLREHQRSSWSRSGPGRLLEAISSPKVLARTGREACSPNYARLLSAMRGSKAKQTTGRSGAPVSLRPSKGTAVAELPPAVSERLLEPGSSRARHSTPAATGPRGRRRPCLCPWSSPCLLCRPGLQILFPILCLRLRLCLCPSPAPRTFLRPSWCTAGRRVPCPCSSGTPQHPACPPSLVALGITSTDGPYRSIPSTRALALALLCLCLCLSGTRRGRRRTETTRVERSKPRMSPASSVLRRLLLSQVGPGAPKSIGWPLLKSTGRGPGARQARR